MLWDQLAGFKPVARIRTLRLPTHNKTVEADSSSSPPKGTKMFMRHFYLHPNFVNIQELQSDDQFHVFKGFFIQDPTLILEVLPEATKQPSKG